MPVTALLNRNLRERKGKWFHWHKSLPKRKSTLCQKMEDPNILQRKRGARLQSVDHTESYETCGCVCAGGNCGEIRIRVETNPHPYEGKYGLPGGREICVGQYLQYIHYARPRLFFLEGIKGTILFIIIAISQQPKSPSLNSILVITSKVLSMSALYVIINDMWHKFRFYGRKNAVSHPNSLFS